MFRFISRQTELDEPVYGLEVLKELHDADYISFDFETTGLDMFTISPVLLGLESRTTYDREGHILPGDVYIIDFLTYDVFEVADALKPLLDKLWIAHNLVYDYMVFQYFFGVKLKNIFCTQLASQVLFNGSDMLKHNYKAVVNRHFKVIINKDDVQSFIGRDLSKPITRTEIEYLRNDLFYLKALYDRQMDLGSPAKKDLQRLFTLENEFIPVMAHMMLNGVGVDGNKWIENHEVYAKQVEALFDEVKELVIGLAEEFQLYGIVKSKKKYQENQISLFEVHEMTSVRHALKDFNARSSDQVKRFLNKLGVVTESTAEDELKKLLYDIEDERIRQFINKLLELRGYEKLVSTYGLTFLNENLNKATFKLHTSYMQCFTDTGRLSSSKPNLQNIPKRKEMRECFIPDDRELYDFVSLDMSGQELRIAASRSQDVALLKSFNEGLDLHSMLAQDSYRIIKDDPEFIVSKKQNEDLRDIHKAVLFGYIFGAGHSRVAEVLNIPKTLAKKVLVKLEDNLHQLSKYQKELKKVVLRERIVVDGSRYNRRQSFDVWRLKPLKDHSIEKKGINFPIQATAASMTKEAGIVLLRYIEDNKLDCQIKLQIHDEYIIQIPKGDVTLATKFKEIMEEVGTSYLVGVKMESSMSIAPYWQK